MGEHKITTHTTVIYSMMDTVANFFGVVALKWIGKEQGKQTKKLAFRLILQSGGDLVLLWVKSPRSSQLSSATPRTLWSLGVSISHVSWVLKVSSLSLESFVESE